MLAIRDTEAKLGQPAKRLDSFVGDYPVSIWSPKHASASLQLWLH